MFLRDISEEGFSSSEAESEYQAVVVFVPLQWGGTVRRRGYQRTALNAIAAIIPMSGGHVRSVGRSCPTLSQERWSKEAESEEDSDTRRLHSRRDVAVSQ